MADQLSILNPHPRTLPGPNLLHDLISSHSQDGSPAIEHLFRDGSIGSITYEQLHRRTSALAQTLLTFWKAATPKSRPAHFVAPVLIPQCIELYVSELAALKAGAAFCPIGVDTPEERLRFILNDVSAKVLLTTTEQSTNLPDLEGIRIILVDADQPQNENEDVGVHIQSSQPAYIMYTSGSTGKPKGVVLSHFAATQSLLAHDRHIPQFSRFLQFASPTFDVSVFEIFFPLFRGRTIVSGDRRQLLNDLPAFINCMEVDAAELTPSVASTLLHGKAGLPTLKVLLTIGEMLKRDVIEEFGASTSEDGILHGMYGPTEAAIHCTLQTSFSTDMPTSNIGAPLDTVSAFVIAPSSAHEPTNGQIKILAIGEEGELAVGGHQLADGYLNRVEQTAASFLDHAEYGRLYRTGDRARMASDGRVECLGRISNGQVKLRGQRVELGEIEYAASRAPGIQTAVADIINGNAIVFCVTQAEVTSAQIRSTCQQWLPVFMVPSDCIPVRTLSYLPSGKVDRNALRELYDNQKPSRRTSTPETNERTNRITEVFSAVLQAPVHAQSRLPAIGLDSLSSIRVSSELQKAGFPQIDATVLLESETVRDVELHLTNSPVTGRSLNEESSFATFASTLRNAVSSHPALATQLDQIDDVLIPTAVQLAMLSETVRDGQAYCNWIKLRAAGYQVDAVQDSLRQLVSHHALLRSGFVPVDDSHIPYAMIVWKTLPPEHLTISNRFDQQFAVLTERDLQLPCWFQLIESSNGVQILLQIHHALYDQWSIEVLRSDLQSILQGHSLPSNAMFHEVSAYHQTNRQSLSPRSSANFWQDLLMDFIPTPLPSMRGTQMPKKLERTIWHTLIGDLPFVRRQSRDLGCSAPMVFQAAVSYLLGNYSGSSDVTFGIVVSGRHIPLPGIERTFGPCLATLPFRIDHSALRTCLDLLLETQSRTRDIQKHAFTPLADIKQSLDCDTNDMLFNTLFIWQESTVPSTEFQNVEELDSSDRNEFDLVIELEPKGTGLQVRFTYQQSLISPDQIEIFIQQLQAVSETILNEPNAPVSSLINCFPDDLRSASNTNPTPRATGRRLVASIEEHATQAPESPAVVFATSIHSSGADIETLTYSELNVRSNSLARYLRSLGALSNDLVCICMDKSINMYIGILATIKAGAGYLPVTPDTPISRLKSILAQSPCKAILCDDRSIEKFHNFTVSIIISVGALDTHCFGTESLAIDPDGSSAAYAVFTSGSTGKPKGIVVDRQNLLGNLQALQEIYQVRPGERLLQACSQAFDVSVFEIFFAFYTGICLCSAPTDELFREIETSICALDITHLSLTPTVAALINPADVPNVKFLVTAGEGITELVHRRWAGKGLHQGYGPSETTNICTLKMNVSTQDVLGNIGRPLSNTSAFVLSLGSPFDVLPLGSIGEFAFGGEQVFRGYIGMDALNLEKIIDHPEFGRVYKSGDLGRMLPDGTLLISGRADDQVKIRGNRIELGEVNAILFSESDIRNCTTILMRDDTADRCLVSFILFAQEKMPAAEQIQLVPVEEGYLAQLFVSLGSSLPSYMIPRLIIPLNRLPLTSQGKLDRHALRRFVETLDDESRISFGQGYEDPKSLSEWSSEELEIAAALEDTIDISTTALSRNRPFFSLGLNSLNAIFFAKAIKSRLKMPVAVSTVLQNQSVGRLAQAVFENAAADRPHTDLVSVPLLPAQVTIEVENICKSFKENIECILPCTPLQEATLATSSTSRRSSYCNSLSLMVHADVSRMRHCWAEMVDRHSILRTRFVSTTDSLHPYVQVVLKDLSLPWREQRLESLELFRSTDNLANDDTSSTVNQAQPFAICLQTSASGTRLILSIHHAIYDAISISRLLREVELRYRGSALAKPTAFETFLCEMQRQNGADAIEFWTEQMRNFVPTSLAPASLVKLNEEVVLHKDLSVSAGDLDLFCKQYAVSHLAVFQSALVKLLSCCQRISDICFGDVVSGRTVSVEGIESLVAPCFNTIPLRTNIERIRTNLALIHQLHAKNSALSPHQLSPLRQIQRLSSDPSKRLFNTLLIFQPMLPQLDSTIWIKEAESGGMGLPLVFEIFPEAESYALTLHFQTNHVSTTMAEYLTEAYLGALQSCLKHPYSDIEAFHQFDSQTIAGCLRSTAKPKTSSSAQHFSDDEWTEEEKAIRQVYSQISKVEEDTIDRNVSMYQLGLDSLNAPQIAARLRVLGFQVDAADVIETPTLAVLATLIKAKSFKHADMLPKVDLHRFHSEHLQHILETFGLDEQSVEAIRPCTSVQNGMLAQSIASGGKLYINHITYSIPSHVSDADIRAAWDAVRTRHQVLRMGFYQLDDGQNPFAMVIFHPGSSKTPLIDERMQRSIEDYEDHTSGAIVESIRTRPCQVATRRHTNESTMTLSLHHALYDARSLRLILADFSTALSGASVGPKTDIDVLLSTSLAAQADMDGRAAEFWRETLLDSSVSRFPDLAPTLAGKRGLKTEDLTSTLTVPEVETYCRLHRATIQALGQSAWGLLLAAYTGDQNVIFGTIFSGETTPGTSNVAFPCMSTIPVSCSASQSTTDLVRNMVDFNASSQRHRFLPLPDIQRLAGHEGRMLFDTIFVYQKQSPDMTRFNWPIARETAAVDYSASLELETRSEDGISIRLTYDTASIPPEQARLIVQQYNHVLAQLVGEHHSTPASILSILPPLEPALSSPIQLLHQFFERSVDVHPSRLAFEFVHANKTQNWTYAELENAANQVAHLIQRCRVPPNSMIAVCMNKCPEASFAFLGILKAGCSFLAIDPDLPVSRLRFILEDSRSQILFGDTEKPRVAIPASAKYIQLTQSTLSSLPTSSVVADGVTTQSTCYCLYTSGTTGTPKGCEISHENAVQAMLAFMRLFKGRWNESSKWLQFASYWFDVSILEQFWSWAVGIAVVGAPRDLVLEDLPGFIRRLSVTHIDLTPSLARLVQPNEVPSLWKGVFITGGEPLREEIIKAWGPVNAVCNGYGPTEATIGVTMNTFIGQDAKPSNIGRQFDNVGTYVLHPGTDEPVLRGTIGELCISGKLVGKGYLNRPDLTLKQFPFFKRFGETVYRTGDLVRMLSDGSFAFIGRADSQSKLRGQRLELGEVERKLRESSDHIHDAVALIEKSEGGKETLIAYIAIATGTKSNGLGFDSSERAIELARTAREACLAQLPAYMVPVHVLAINKLPLTVNNKIDSKRLTTMFHTISMKELQALQGGANAARTLNMIEQTISGILQKLLQIDAVDIVPQSNLFSLGLSSISAIPFASLLKQAGFQRASIGTVMRNSTLEKLGRALSKSIINQRNEQQSIQQARLWMAAFNRQYLPMATKLLLISPDDIDIVAPCTPLQQGLIIESLKEDRPHFNEFRYELIDNNFSSLKWCLEKLMSTTQILRTRFLHTEEGFAQVVLRRDEINLSKWNIALAHLEGLFSELRTKWQSHNDLTLVVPLQFHFIETERKSYFTVQIHHALYDGISYDLMLSRLVDLHCSYVAAEAGPDFTTALTHGPLRTIMGAMEFWINRFQHAHYIPLPRRLDSNTLNAVMIRFPLQHAESLETIRKALGVSHQAIVQSCYELALHQHAPDLEVYGIVCSGRSLDLEGAERVIGPMFNTLPHPLRFNRHSTISEHVQGCHHANTESIPFQHTSLRDIRKWCGQQFSDGIFDVLFVFQHVPKSSLSLDDKLFKHVETAPRAHYALACEAEMDDEGCISMTLLAQEPFFTREDLDSLRAKISAALDCLLTKPDTPLRDVVGIPTTVQKRETPQQHTSLPSVNGIQEFKWTQDGYLIRDTIAQLSGLNLSDIDEHSSIFTLGLDSIDAVKLASRLKRAGLTIPVSRILQAQTIPRILEASEQRSLESEHPASSSIAQNIKQRIRNSVFPSVTSVDDVEDISPATPLQEALVADMLRSNLTQYFNHDVLRLAPGTDIRQLESAWQHVVDMTPILRTSFMEVFDPDINATFAQIVHRPAALQVLEFKCNSFDQLSEIFEKIKRDVLSKLPSVPPFRLSTVTIDSDRYLILSLAHALYDGHSIALLHKDVHHAYNDRIRPRPSYDDAINVALALSQDDARAYWTSVLANSQMQSFPRMLESGERHETFHREKRSTISHHAARTFCRAYGISMQALAQSCWAVTLAHYFRHLDVHFGVVLACRDSEEREQMMFPMMNAVVTRSTLHGSRVQMVQYMQGLISDMRPYQRTPLRHVQAWATKSGPQGPKPINGVFDTLFMFQQRPSSTITIGDALYESVGGRSAVEYPVAVEIEARKEDLIIRASCSNDVMDAAGTTRLLEKVDSVLQAIVENPEHPTVDFHEDEISLCGLESIFMQPADDTLVQDGPEVARTDHSLDSLPSFSTSEVIKVLSEVSKTPVEEILPASTIESIGIDSISAIKVSALLRKQSINITVSEIVRARTPVRIAGVVTRNATPLSNDETEGQGLTMTSAQAYDVGTIAARLGVNAQNIEAVLPATAGQAYMLSTWKKTDGQQFYSTFSYRLEVKLSLERVEEAWSRLVQCHAILRTVFCVAEDHSVLQVVLRDTSVGDEGPAQQPMVSMKAASRSDGVIADVSIHHALYDAVSLPLLMQDFQVILATNPTVLPQIKFEDFLALSAAPRVKEAQKEFWTQYLQDLSPRKLSQSHVSGAQDRVETFRPKLFYGVAELENKARKENLTIQALLFAAYAKVYAGISSIQGSDTIAQEAPDDVIIGIYLSNRSYLPELDTLPAPTLNLVPLAIRAPHERSLLDIARQIMVDLQNISTAENSAVGLAEIYEWTKVKIDTFVNFLKLPERARVLDEDGGKAKVVLEELDDRRTRERCELVSAQEQAEEWRVPPELENLRTDAYQHSLDIEMTITDGKLGVGLFCPASMIGLEDAEKALEDLKMVLEKVVGKEKLISE